MILRRWLFMMGLVIACTQDEENSQDTKKPEDPDNDEWTGDWGDLYNKPPEAFFAADLSENVRSGVTSALTAASETTGRPVHPEDASTRPRLADSLYDSSQPPPSRSARIFVVPFRCA